MLAFVEVFYNVALRLSNTVYVTSNLLFLSIVVILTMFKHLEQGVVTIDANDEDSEEIEEIRPRVTHFKEMTKRMRMKYANYFDTPEKMNLLVHIAPTFDPRYNIAGLELSLCDLFDEA